MLRIMAWALLSHARFRSLFCARTEYVFFLCSASTRPDWSAQVPSPNAAHDTAWDCKTWNTSFPAR